jgi:hypothetical protein
MYATSWLSGRLTGTGRRNAASSSAMGRVLGPVAGLALGLAVLAGCGSVTAPGGASSGGASSGGASSGGASSGGPAAGGSAAPGGATSATPSNAAGTQAPLCADVGQVSKLVVIRSRGMNKIQELHFPFPPRVVVTGAATARSVARAVCALPKMSSGTLHCPAELIGTSYQLIFTANRRELPVVTAQATGCQEVTGAGPPRQAATSPGFWQVLGRAMGLYSPGPPVFRGEGPAAAECRTAAFRVRMVSGCPATSQLGSGFRK